MTLSLSKGRLACWNFSDRVLPLVALFSFCSFIFSFQLNFGFHPGVKLLEIFVEVGEYFSLSKLFYKLCQFLDCVIMRRADCYRDASHFMDYKNQGAVPVGKAHEVSHLHIPAFDRPPTKAFSFICATERQGNSFPVSHLGSISAAKRKFFADTSVACLP